MSLIENRSLLNLPAELRQHIFDFVLEDGLCYDGFFGHREMGGIYLDPHYSAAHALRLLLTCSRFYADASLLALSRTNFIISNLYANIPERLATLHPKQVGSIRSIAFRADDRHFRKLQSWGKHPFGVSSLRLETLTIVLHRSSFWHYLFDYTADIVKLLRQLQGVQRFVFVRNGALVKGSFKTWYNRLVGLIMKIDHHERYNVSPANPEHTWWKWDFDELAQKITLQALPAKPMVGETTYMEQIVPLMEELRISVENEEWNPDPRARNHYY